MDSMQIYRSLDIGTAKPTRDEQTQTPHHLIDIKNPDETCSAAQWAHDARAAIEEIHGRGKTPLVVGGTGFYARALLHPETLASAPPNLELRAQLQNETEKHGVIWLHDQLRVLDMDAANRLQVNDTRRVMRAIEVAISRHKSVVSDELAAETQNPKLKTANSVIFGLDWPRETLYRRIETRIDAMLRDGFLDELRCLDALNLPPNATALQSLGYKQMRATLNDAALDDQSVFDECLATWKRDTRRFAKRQMTWFRHQLPTRWIEVDDATNWAKIADDIVVEYSKCADSR